MHKKENLTHYTTRLGLFLGFLFITTSCAAAPEPVYYNLDKVVVCQEVGEPNQMCDGDDQNIEFPIQGIRPDGTTTLIESTNGEYLIRSNEFASWNLKYGTTFKGYCVLDVISHTYGEMSMTKTEIFVTECQ